MGHTYRELIVWQKSKALALEVYRLTAAFPRSELYGLTSQVRRAAVSVPSNIAEGQGRLTKGEFVQFVGQARRSLLELETQLSIARDLGFMSEADLEMVERRIAEVLRLTNALIDSMKTRAKSAGA